MIVAFLAKLCSQNLIVIHLKVFIDLESVKIVRGDQGDVKRQLTLLVSTSEFHVHLCSYFFWNWNFAIYKEGKINLEGDISPDRNVDVVKSLDSFS